LSQLFLANTSSTKLPLALLCQYTTSISQKYDEFQFVFVSLKSQVIPRVWYTLRSEYFMHSCTMVFRRYVDTIVLWVETSYCHDRGRWCCWEAGDSLWLAF